MSKGINITEEEKEFARALLAAGKSYRRVAEAMALSVGSVHKIANEPVEKVEPLVAEVKRRFAMKHWLLADHILGSISDRRVVDASLKDRALAAAILTDKALMLEKALPPSGPSMPQSVAVVVRPDALRVGFRMNGDEHF